MNWVISFTKRANCIKFGIHVGEFYPEGTVSQIFYLGLSLIFMKCRKLG